ncbi:HipA domain-containing protein [Alkalimonas collagenimarina]|uniref:HipA domain-containing protein n=1 Tax=Alkalimonas collagenimarina TaxID=400390 RepID=A0ABT9GW04_9GAMM|nr:HipA domain-containing protein [Alkalimonas collagenimarina]MDP4535133.1 HipA domain-containing protein [Alkalimonas collagenimarina]
MTKGRVGYIYSHQHFVGELAEVNTPKGSEYHFSYAASYLAKGLAPIGFHLPLTTEPYIRNSLPPFFANLMSEGWVKRHQARRARLDQDDKFGLLLGHGAELIGPLSIVTAFQGNELTTPGRALPSPVRKLDGYSINFARAEFNDVAFESLDKASISGVQPKMFLKVMPKKHGLSLTNAVGMGPYIVKPSPAGLPELAENEYMIMRLCKRVGFDVADHHLVPFSCGELAYVTGRFDLERKGKRPEFIEDMASALDVAPGNKSDDSLSYERTLIAAHQLCGGHAQVLIMGFRQVVMAYIVGNNDMHLKNLALLRPMDSLTATGFTKVYDMLSVAPYRLYDRAGYLSLCLLEAEATDSEFTSSYEHYGYYTRHDFIQLAKKIGLGEKLGDKLISQLCEKVGRAAEDVILKSPGSDALKHVILERIKERLKVLRQPAF